MEGWFDIKKYINIIFYIKKCLKRTDYFSGC